MLNEQDAVKREISQSITTALWSLGGGVLVTVDVAGRYVVPRIHEHDNIGEEIDWHRDFQAADLRMKHAVDANTKAAKESGMPVDRKYNAQLSEMFGRTATIEGQQIQALVATQPNVDPARNVDILSGVFVLGAVLGAVITTGFRKASRRADNRLEKRYQAELNLIDIEC